MLVAEVCRLQGHDVIEAGTGAQAIELGRSSQPDLVLVDWVLPDISGTEVIRELRRQGVVSPMVMLTGRSTRMDEVVGLEVGADDYITKPFDSRILAARINAHLRRSALAETGGGREGVLSIGALQIDNAARRVKVGEDEITLTMTEFNLLAVLAANPERVLTRAQLRDKVWGYPHDLDDHSVDPTCSVCGASCRSAPTRASASKRCPALVTGCRSKALDGEGYRAVRAGCRRPRYPRSRAQKGDRDRPSRGGGSHGGPLRGRGKADPPGAGAPRGDVRPLRPGSADPRRNGRRAHSRGDPGPRRRHRSFGRASRPTYRGSPSRRRSRDRDRGSLLRKIL